MLEHSHGLNSDRRVCSCILYFRMRIRKYLNLYVRRLAMNKKARECYERKSEKHASVFKFYAVSSEIFEMVGGVFFILLEIYCLTINPMSQ